MLETFIERVYELREPSGFRRLLATHLEDIGFEHFAYISFTTPYPQKTARAILNYPLEWLYRYAEGNYYRYDPVLDQASWTLEPYDWLQCRDPESMSAAQARVMNEAGDFGLRQGIGLPIHRPDGGMAMLSVATRKPRRQFEEAARAHWTDLHTMALCFHAALAQNINGHKPLRVDLTRAEREVLLRSAGGDGIEEISEKLGCPDAFIQACFRSVMDKLDACTPRQAVVEAVANRVIEL